VLAYQKRPKYIAWTFNVVTQLKSDQSKSRENCYTSTPRCLLYTTGTTTFKFQGVFTRQVPEPCSGGQKRPKYIAWTLNIVKKAPLKLNPWPRKLFYVNCEVSPLQIRHNHAQILRDIYTAGARTVLGGQKRPKYIAWTFNVVTQLESDQT